MKRHQRVHALEVGARGEQHGGAASSRARLAATEGKEGREEKAERHGE
jgi:hypothetical protein